MRYQGVLTLFVLLALLLQSNWVYAGGQYAPTSALLPVGTESTYNGASNTTGNVGWQGTLALESTPGYNWTVNTDAANGLDQQVRFDGVSLNGANKMIITIAANAGSASLNRYYQVCDWVSSAAVDNAADANCTGGGWRTLNKTNGTIRAPIAETTQRTYTWHVYDGYWTTAVTTSTPVSTPLSNFISGSNRVLVRAYSNTALATTHLINWANLEMVVDSIYFPAGFTNISGGYATGSIVSLQNPPTLISGTGVTGDDSIYMTVSSTPSAADFYYSFKNVKTYPGMNSVLVRARSVCSATAAATTYRFRIYNFNSSSWEDLTTDLACSTTAASNQFAKGNITISNYIQGGEMRIGMYSTSAPSNIRIGLDQIYIMVGSVNSDSSQCEISFGTGTATDCANTRDMDTNPSSTQNVWSITSEAESASMAHGFYGYDNDADAVGGEQAISGRIALPITPPANSSVVSLIYANRFRSNLAALTLSAAALDESGVVSTAGGITSIGATNASAVYTYSDSIGTSYLNASTWDLSSYAGQIPVDYDNGGGSVAVWTSSGSCSGNPDLAYPSVGGLSTTIAGGDVYSYSAATGGGGGAVVASSGITISTVGLIQP
jgi:hypothetical protein